MGLAQHHKTGRERGLSQVDAIAKKGGWLLLGWDLSEEENEVEQRKVQENVTTWVSGLKLFSMGL